MSDLTVGECECEGKSESESVIGYISNHVVLVLFTFNCPLFCSLYLFMSFFIHTAMLSTIVTSLLPRSPLNTILLACFFTSRYYHLFSYSYLIL